MNSKIREVQSKYIPFMEEYRWLDSYADEIWQEAQKEILDKLIKKVEDDWNNDKLEYNESVSISRWLKECYEKQL